MSESSPLLPVQADLQLLPSTVNVERLLALWPGWTRQAYDPAEGWRLRKDANALQLTLAAQGVRLQGFIATDFPLETLLLPLRRGGIGYTLQLMLPEGLPELRAWSSGTVRLVDRRVQRAGGVLIAALGGGMSLFVVRSALSGPTFSLGGALLFPAFLVMGLALVLIPGPNEERAERGISLDRSQPLTPRWLLVTGLCLLAGVVNALFLKYA